MQVDELHGYVEPEHECALVSLMKPGRHIGEHRLSGRYRDADRVLLACIPHIGSSRYHHVGGVETLALEELHRIALELVVPVIYGAHRFVGCSEDRGAGEVLLVVGCQHSPRAEVAWRRGNDDLANVELASEGGGMHRPAPAEGHQHIFPRPVALSD